MSTFMFVELSSEIWLILNKVVLVSMINNFGRKNIFWLLHLNKLGNSKKQIKGIVTRR